MNQQIRFCKSFDGTQLAYAMTGAGPPLVRAPHWLTHLEYEWQSPIWKPWIEALSRSHRLLRMDERGCGLSDRDVADFSFEAWVRDLEAVADAAGLERFALFGHSQGGAIALHTGLRHGERLAGVMALSTYVPLADTLAAEASPVNRDLPIFMAHGTADPMIPFARAQASRDLLLQQSYTLEWHEYRMQHSVCPQEIADIGAWLGRVLA